MVAGYFLYLIICRLYPCISTMPPTLLRLLTNPTNGITHIPLSPYEFHERHHAYPTNGINSHNLHNLQYMYIYSGSEAAITPLSFAGFSSMKAMCTAFNDNPKEGSRPFDADRCGFVMGEGIYNKNKLYWNKERSRLFDADRYGFVMGEGIYMDMYICIHMCICMCVSECVCVYIYTYMYTLIHMYIYICIYRSGGSAAGDAGACRKARSNHLRYTNEIII